MITFKIEFWSHKNNEWVDFTKYAVFAPKTGDFYDERLDEAYFQLIRCPYAAFPPMTEARITFTCKRGNIPSGYAAKLTARSDIGDNVTMTYNAQTKELTQTYTFNCILANDSSLRQPIFQTDKNGNKLYKHEFYLIESTKILEGFIGDNLTFTNALGTNYGT